MNEVLDAAWSMMVTVDDFAEVVLSGVPRKSEPHRLLLPPPQTQRRPHGTGLEPAGPTARPSGEAETAVVAWTPRGNETQAKTLPLGDEYEYDPNETRAKTRPLGDEYTAMNAVVPSPH